MGGAPYRGRVTPPSSRRCAADDAPCRRPVDAASPVPLCPQHLALAADHHAEGHGVVDLLPSPCPACASRHGLHRPSGWQCAVCEWRQGEVPDGELPPPRVDVVYWLRFGDRVKIGTTANPRQRLGRLWHDELLAFERGDRVVEHRRHVEFAEHRHGRTEWFVAHPELLARAELLRAGVDDPWRQHARWVSEALALRG